MPRGHKDYGQGQETIIIHTVSDLGELAARTGSPNKYHRGGNVVFQTGFENGLDNCGFSSGLGGAEHNLIGTPTYVGGMSCQLKNKGIDILFRPIELTKIGFEIAFQPRGDTNSLQMLIDYDDASDLYSFDFTIYYQLDEVYIVDDGGNYVKIKDYLFTNKYVNLWHIMKGIIDLENLTYHKFFLNNINCELTEYEPQKSVSSGDERITCTFFPYPTTGDISEVIIDNIIITINET